VPLRAQSVKKASAQAVSIVLSKRLYNNGAYVGIHSTWSLQDREDIDRLFDFAAA